MKVKKIILNNTHLHTESGEELLFFPLCGLYIRGLAAYRE